MYPSPPQPLLLPLPLVCRRLLCVRLILLPTRPRCQSNPSRTQIDLLRTTYNTLPTQGTDKCCGGPHLTAPQRPRQGSSA